MKTAIGILTTIAGAALQAAGILLIVQAVVERRRRHKEGKKGIMGR